MTALLAFLSSLAISYAGTRLLLRRPPVRGFVDVPNERSSHDRPKPRFGGIAIVSSFAVTFAALCVWRAEFRPFLPLAAGFGVLFVAGILDDWRGLAVGARFIAQGIAAAIAIAAGVVVDRATLPGIGTVHLGWLSIPVTALIFVASINFYNFIDGIDGLAAGSAMIASVFLSAAAFMVGQPVFGVIYLAAAGSALGFLQYNFPPSRLFMGDGGSTFFGYFFAYLAVAGNRAVPEIPLVVPLLLLSSLYLDAGLTVLNRIARREKVFQPHRTHYYQRLLQIGLNHKQVTLLEYLVTMLLGASALLYVRSGGWFLPFVAAAWVVAFALAILKIRGLERGDRLFWERRTMFMVATDLVAIVVAYLGAYFLRMNFQFTPTEGRAVLQALPIVVIVRTACFFKFGLYRSMWRYTTTGDVVRVIKAVTVGSAVILAVVVLMYRFVAFPRSLFVIEYALLILLILGVRFSARLFHEIGREGTGDAVRRYAVIGAGDAAERVARDVNAGGPREAVVCFIDDEPARFGLRIHGAPVDGPRERLAEICRRYHVDALVYALEGADESVALDWATRARAAGVAIEEKPGAALVHEPDAIVLQRVAATLGRPAPVTHSRVPAALSGRRVLITNGGGGFGASLVASLRAVGAVPVLHFGDASGRHASRAPADAAFLLGSLAHEAASMVAAVNPDVVIHVVDVAPPGALNDDEYAWNHVVRESESLSRAAFGRPGCRFVVAASWDVVRPGDAAAAVAAVMEAIVLNRAGADPAAVIRLPRVLTAARLASGPETREPFDLLESECAALILEIAAGGFRGIYAPTPGRAFAAPTARAETGDRGEPTSAPGSNPVFPTEHLDECGVEGARRVLSPLFPASDPFRRLAVSGPVSPGGAGRDEWVRAVSSQLYVLAPHQEAFRS